MYSARTDSEFVVAVIVTDVRRNDLALGLAFRECTMSAVGNSRSGIYRKDARFQTSMLFVGGK